MADGAIGVSATLQGLQELLARCKAESLVEPRKQFFERAGQVVEAKAKELVPPSDHRSAALRRNITHDSDESHVAIGNNLRYAPYVHGWFDETKTRTKPHWVPQAVMADLGKWAAAHGLVDDASYSGGKSFAQGGRRRLGGRTAIVAQNLRAGRRIAAGIAKRGTPLVPYLTKGLEQSQGELERLIGELGEAVTKAVQP